MQTVILLPRDSTGFLQQEECCWNRGSRYTPGLALHAHAFYREQGDSVRLLPMDLAEPEELDLPDQSRIVLIHTWIFGAELDEMLLRLHLAGSERYPLTLIANPPGAADRLAPYWPGACVAPSSELFSETRPLELSALSTFDFSLPTPALSRILYQFSTGCRWKCKFCVWRNEHRIRDPVLCASEISQLCELIPQAAADRSGDKIELLGNEITGKSDWLKPFCNSLPTGIRWSADINVRNATLEDLARARAAGLTRVCLGIEFLSNPVLKRLVQGHTCFDAARVMGWLQQLGISYRFSLRHGIGETPEELADCLAWLGALHGAGRRPDYITIGPMFQWPGSEWIPAGVETVNYGTEKYPRPTARLTDEQNEGWKKIREFCKTHHWVK